MGVEPLSDDCLDCRDSIIAQAEARFRTMFAAAPVGIVLADLATDDIVEANEAYCRIVGRSHDEIMRNGWKGITHPDDVAEGTARLNDLRAGRTNGYSLGKRYLKPDGEIVWANIEITKIEGYDPGIGPQYLVIVADVTESKKIEQALAQQNAELERFTYTVSHELKAPLVTINGFLGLLEKDINSGDRSNVHKDVQMISSAVRTMGQQLDNLLELSRIGRVVHPSEQFSLTRLCEGVTERMAGVIEQYRGRVDFDSDMPEAFADPVRIREVMQNLIENGLKFSSQVTEPRIGISAVVDGSKILCRVRDNGPGIEKRYHERVFELFDRLDTQVQGTGIGLSLVKRNVEIHDGDVWIESSGNGDGTTVCFTLPAA